MWRVVGTGRGFEVPRARTGGCLLVYHNSLLIITLYCSAVRSSLSFCCGAVQLVCSVLTAYSGIYRSEGVGGWGEQLSDEHLTTWFVKGSPSMFSLAPML